MIIKRGVKWGYHHLKKCPLQVKSVLCSFLIVFGLVTAVVGTYLAVVDMGWCSRCALGLEDQDISKNSWRPLIPLELWSKVMNLYHSFLVDSMNKMWCWKVPLGCFWLHKSNCTDGEIVCTFIFLKFFFVEIGDVAILACCDLFAVFCSPKRWKNWQVSVRYVRRNRFW